MIESRVGSAVNVSSDTAFSRSHWSGVTSTSDFHDLDDEANYSVEANLEHFQQLWNHPRWGRFVKVFSDDFVIGKKIAEGGQADFYEFGRGYLVKVSREVMPSNHFNNNGPKLWLQNFLLRPFYVLSSWWIDAER